MMVSISGGAGRKSNSSEPPSVRLMVFCVTNCGPFHAEHDHQQETKKQRDAKQYHEQRGRGRLVRAGPVKFALRQQAGYEQQHEDCDGGDVRVHQ